MVAADGGHHQFGQQPVHPGHRVALLHPPAAGGAVVDGAPQGGEGFADIVLKLPAVLPHVVEQTH